MCSMLRVLRHPELVVVIPALTAVEGGVVQRSTVFLIACGLLLESTMGHEPW